MIEESGAAPEKREGDGERRDDDREGWVELDAAGAPVPAAPGAPRPDGERRGPPRVLATWGPPPAGESPSVVLRALARNFVVFNPLFLLSAMLVLGGTMLVNTPDAAGRRPLSLLYQLMSAIGAYEATLVCAAVFLALRPRLERDVRNLALVLAPFLVDVTFTKAALATSLLHAHGTVVAVAFGTATLAAALAEAAVAARAAGRRFDALEWCALGAAPLLATAFPIAGRLAEEHAPEAVLAGGAGLAALALLFAHVAARGAPASESLRRLAWIALPAAAWQAGAMTWTLEGELSLLAGPALIALGPALPWLAWPEDAARDRVTPFALPIVGALVCGAPGAWAFGAGAWTLGLVGCAAVHAVFALRTGGLHFVAGVAGAALLAAGGPTIAASLASIGRNPLEAALLLGLFGYGVARRAPPVALALLLGRGALVLARVLPLGAALDDVVALAVAGAGVLAFTHRVHGCGPAGRLLRLLGSTLLYAPACEVALDGGAAAGPARWIAALALAGLLAAGIRLRLPAYWAPPAVAPVVLATRRAPSSAIGWGATAIAAAFGAVGLGVALSVFRESILAWIGEERDGRDGAG